MISFFRKIRQKLLQNNNVTRYLIYALGEIILMVLGILIALQVNNWNELRKSQETEQRLLKALLIEFESNLEILEETIELNDSIIFRSTRLGNFTGPTPTPGISEKELSDLMVGVFKYDSRYLPEQGTIDEIISSGKLSLFSDPVLRKSLSSLQTELTRVAIQEDYVLSRRDIAHEFFLKNGNFRRHLELINESLLDVSPSKFPPNDFGFLQNQEFESDLYLFNVASNNLKQNYYLVLHEDIQSLIALIQKNIN